LQGYQIKETKYALIFTEVSPLSLVQMADWASSMATRKA
jgi:hypothetical protein